MMQFKPDKKAAALLRKYEPITLDVSHDLDISVFGGRGWREVSLGGKHWRINDVEVTDTEWQIVYYCLHPQSKPRWTDELTKWDFIDLDGAVERILDRVQTESAPDSPKN